MTYAMLIKVSCFLFVTATMWFTLRFASQPDVEPEEGTNPLNHNRPGG